MECRPPLLHIPRPDSRLFQIERAQRWTEVESSVRKARGNQGVLLSDGGGERGQRRWLGNSYIRNPPFNFVRSRGQFDKLEDFDMIELPSGLGSRPQPCQRQVSVCEPEAPLADTLPLTETRSDACLHREPNHVENPLGKADYVRSGSGVFSVSDTACSGPHSAFRGGGFNETKPPLGRTCAMRPSG